MRFNRVEANATQAKPGSLIEWHEKLVHQNMEHVKSVLAKNNINVKTGGIIQCEECLEGKIHRLPFRKSDTKSSRTCEIIHADTCGPMEVPSVGGSRYFVIIKDDFSNYRSVYFVKKKDEVKDCIENFLNKAENITGNKVLYFRSDNGLEFVNKQVQQLFSSRGIVHQLTVPYSPEQNGKAERENRTLVEAARTLLCSKNLPKKLWAEAINTATYVLNRTGKSNDSEKTPYESWTGKTFCIHNLYIFGTPVAVHVPKEKRRKWDSKVEKGVMVGYGENVKGFRIYYPQKNTVEIKRDVVFTGLEKSVTVKDVTLMPEPDSEETEHSTDCEKVADNVIIEDSSTDKTVNESDVSLYVPCTSDEDSDVSDEVADVNMHMKSQRNRKQTSFYKCNNVIADTSEPTTYQEAMLRNDASKWEEAITRELETLKENNTWEICDKFDKNNLVSSKWVFKIKNANNSLQYKARLVARGFEQNDMLNLDEIYAPVAKLSTFRLFLSVATKLNLPVHW